MIVEFLFALLVVGGYVFLAGLAVVMVAAVVLNEGEHRDRREAHEDIGERARIRALSHEAVAKHDLYFVAPADRRVERRWHK